MGNFSAKSYFACAQIDGNGIVIPNSINGADGIEGTYNVGYFEDATKQRKLVLIDRNGGHNAFEGTLVYTPVVGGTASTTTWYIPAGVRSLTRAYKDTGTGIGQTGPDKVITVMKRLAWWNRTTGALETKHPYAQAPDDLGL